jgi:hypothetical protein
MELHIKIFFKKEQVQNGGCYISLLNMHLEIRESFCVWGFYLMGKNGTG